MPRSESNFYKGNDKSLIPKNLSSSFSKQIIGYVVNIILTHTE